MTTASTSNYLQLHRAPWMSPAFIDFMRMPPAADDDDPQTGAAAT